MLVTEINDCRPVKLETVELRTYRKLKTIPAETTFEDHATLQSIFKTQNDQSINRYHTYADARHGLSQPMVDEIPEHFKTNQCDSDHLKTNQESDQAVCYYNITTIPPHIYDEVGTANEPNIYEELPLDTILNSDRSTSNATASYPVLPETLLVTLNTSEMIFNNTDDSVIINREISSSIVQRLTVGKKTYSFWDFTIFTAHAVFKEVENFTFIDVFYLSAAIMIIFGAFHGFKCKISFPFVPLCFTMITFGVFAVISSLANITRKYLKPKETTLRYLVWICRGTMLFFSALGISELYTYHPPNQEDKDSLSFCPAMMYWTAFYYFHLTAFTFVVILLTIFIILMYYFT